MLTFILSYIWFFCCEPCRCTENKSTVASDSAFSSHMLEKVHIKSIIQLCRFTALSESDPGTLSKLFHLCTHDCHRLLDSSWLLSSAFTNWSSILQPARSSASLNVPMSNTAALDLLAARSFQNQYRDAAVEDFSTAVQLLSFPAATRLCTHIGCMHTYYYLFKGTSGKLWVTLSWCKN